MGRYFDSFILQIMKLPQNGGDSFTILYTLLLQKALKNLSPLSVIPGLCFPLLDEIVFPVHPTNFLLALKYESICASGPGKWKAKMGGPVLLGPLVMSGGGEGERDPKHNMKVKTESVLVRKHLLIKI